LKKNGYLLFVTPISWLSPSTNIQSGNDLLHNVFLKYDLLYLNLNECKKYFKVGSTFSYYLIRKSITECITDVISEYKKKTIKSKINMKNYTSMKFLPIHITEESIELVKDVVNTNDALEKNLTISRSRTLDSSAKNTKKHLVKNDIKNENEENKKKYETFIYPTYHTTTTSFYSDIKQNNYNKYRVLLNMSGYIKPTMINEGNTTESKFFIEVDNEDEANKIITLLNSEKISKYLELCKYSGFNSRIVLESIVI